MHHFHCYSSPVRARDLFCTLGLSLESCPSFPHWHFQVFSGSRRVVAPELNLQTLPYNSFLTVPWKDRPLCLVAPIQVL